MGCRKLFARGGRQALTGITERRNRNSPIDAEGYMGLSLRKSLYRMRFMVRIDQWIELFSTRIKLA